MKNTRFFTVILALTALCLFMCTSALAQRNPTMAGQRSDSDRDALYAQFTENRKIPLPDKQRLAYYAAKEYLKRYDDGSDENAAQLRKFVSEYEKVLKHFNIYSLYVDKKYLKTFEAG